VINSVTKLPFDAPTDVQLPEIDIVQLDPPIDSRTKPLRISDFPRFFSVESGIF